MKRPAIARRALLLAAASIVGVSPAAPQATKPQRVASINLSADEVLVEILPPGRLVSVTRWADAEGTSNVVGRVPKSVHRFVKADMEQLVALEPDLVVVSEYTDADFMKQLERSGLRVHRMLGLSTLAGVRGAILDLGRAVGEDEAAPEHGTISHVSPLARALMARAPGDSVTVGGHDLEIVAIA